MKAKALFIIALAIASTAETCHDQNGTTWSCDPRTSASSAPLCWQGEQSDRPPSLLPAPTVACGFGGPPCNYTPPTVPCDHIPGTLTCR
jgi:hypothetical protein